MVHDATTLKAMHVTPMQVDNGQGQVGAWTAVCALFNSEGVFLDYGIIDKTIELIHDPRFYSKIFS